MLQVCLFSLSLLNYLCEISAPHLAEIFNAIFNILSRSVLVVTETEV